MNNKKKPINQQYAAIDTLYWEMLQGNAYYGKSADVSGVVHIENDKKKLFDDIENGINKGLDFNDIKQTADFDFENASVTALTCGEEKGFILGFLYAAQIFTEISAGRELARSKALENLKNDERQS